MVTNRKISFATTIGNWKGKLSLQAWSLGEEQKMGKYAHLGSTHNCSVFEFFFTFQFIKIKAMNYWLAQTLIITEE